MAYSYFTQLFSGGINKDVNPAALDLGAQNASIAVLADAANLLFERGVAFTRPGLLVVGGTSLPSTTNLVALKSTLLQARVPTSTGERTIGAFAGMDTNGAAPTTPSLYNLNCDTNFASFLTPTQITGPAPVQGDVNRYWSSSIVNGVVMIGGFQGTANAGMIRWVPGSTTYTQPAYSYYQYVCGHLSRAVGAFDLSFSTSGFPQTVAWSVPGDETLWGAPNFLAGAGISVLGDVDDTITGLDVAQGFVVVARTYGFHLGIPTGATPPYDWRKMASKSIGVMHPATFTVYKNTLFFVSEQGIHMYDLSTMTDIGEGIYKEIIGLVRQYNLILRGFISAGYASDFEPSYNLVLDSQSTLTGAQVQGLPHYMFNLKEQKWSRHVYQSNGASSSWPWTLNSIDQIPSNVSGVSDPSPVPLMVAYQRTQGSAPVAYQWSLGQAQESAAYFTTGQLTLADQTQDLQVSRLLLVYYASPGGYVVTIQFNWLLDGVAQTKTLTFTTPTAGGWQRQWISFRATGSFFQVQVSTPAIAPTPTIYKALVFEYTEVGKQR